MRAIALVPYSLAACLSLGSLPLLAQSWSHVSLGEIREVFVWQDPTDAAHQKVWLAEDGGRVRFGDRQNGVTTWTQQNTPATVRGPLLDIFFLDGGMRGLACGTDGRIIATLNGGTTWFERPQVFENGTTPALLWGTYFFDSNFGVLAGDKVLRYTQNGGTTWANVTVVEPGGGHYQFVLYYSFDFIENADSTPRHGVVTVKPARILYTANATQWSVARIFDLNGNPATFVPGFELWDVQFEPNPADPDAARGYCAGGGGPTRVFRTDDSGQSWHEEPITGNATNVPYGVTCWSTDDAAACGYGGMILHRTSAGWSQISPTSAGDPCNLAGSFTAPLVGIDATPAGDLWIGGTFGYVRSGNFNQSTTLTQDTPQNAAMWRLGATAFRSDLVGYVGSQVTIGATTDGGVTWTTAKCTRNVTVMRDIALDNASGGVAVGEAQHANDPAAYVLNAGVWQSSSLTGLHMTGVAWSTGTTYVAVGWDGTVLRTTDGGASFTSGGNIPVTSHLEGVTVVSPSTAFAVGADTSAAVVYVTSDLDNTAAAPTWLQLPVSGGGAKLHAVASRTTGSTTEVYAVGDGGVVLSFNGSGFTPVLGAHGTTTHHLRAVALPSGSDNIFIGGNNGVMLHFNGSLWGMPAPRTSKNIVDFWFRDGGFAYAACVNGGDTAGSEIGSISNSCFIRWH